MAEELQHLIDRIQKEAVDRAEQDAQRIVSSANEKAADIVREAELSAKKIIEKADSDSQAYTERSIRALEQSSRDVLITVGQGVENILSDLVVEALDEVMDIDVLKKLVVKISEAYVAREGEVSRVDFLISQADQKELVRFFGERYRKHLGQGLEVHVDNEIVKGFKVSFVDDHIQHDFTKEAIAEALSNFLRPHLSEIVHRAARHGVKAEGASA